MQINLTPHLDRFVLRKLKSGGYNDVSEVVREALRKIEDDDTLGVWVVPRMTTLMKFV